MYVVCISITFIHDKTVNIEISSRPEIEQYNSAFILIHLNILYRINNE